MQNNKWISFTNATLLDGFWKDRYLLNKNVSIEAVKNRFEESGRFDALRFNYKTTGKKPHFYYDSDVAKWIEGVAYLIENGEKDMERYIPFIDALILDMKNAQQPDGYLNSYHQQLDSENIFKIRDKHELYCAGHLIEAAIAYAKATNKTTFLEIMEKYCDLIYKAFIEEKTASFITPGHQEIELALFKLYHYTKNEKYYEMGKFFLENRGNKHDQALVENVYNRQDDVDIYHLQEANGHAVRAVYFYSGIADLSMVEKNELLKDNLNKVFDDIILRKMYVTGGIGSTFNTESFTLPYDLPNKTAYSESCAAIGFVLFASRMREMEKNAKYGDLIERVIYNSMISSTSLDGTSFFYENPLEIALEEYGRQVSAPENRRERLPIKQRVKVFDCSCCPPNINRMFAIIGNFIAVEDDGHLTIEEYISSNLKTNFGDIKIDGDYYKTGKMQISSTNYAGKEISFRVPSWCDKLQVKVNGNEISPIINDGYINLLVDSNFTICLDFNICPILYSSNPCVNANVGRVAFGYGPIIYCIEGVDNGERLNQISIDTDKLSMAKMGENYGGLPTFTMPAFRDKKQDGLYVNSTKTGKEEIILKLIPYYTFANRGESDMQVWIRKA